MAMDMLGLAVGMGYTEESLKGAGAVKGNDGVSISKIEQTVTSTESSGENIITVTKSDGSKSTFSVYNGAKGERGADGADGAGGNSSNIRFKAVQGITHVGKCYNFAQKIVQGKGEQYNCIEYTFDGTEKKVRLSGATTGSSSCVAYCFVDDALNVIAKAEFKSGELFENVVLDIPSGATKIYVNGNGYESPHLEVAVEDKMSDLGYLSQLLGRFGKKLQYKDKFAWKPMPKAFIAFTFDDSLDDISTIVDLFISKGVPCCFGAIPDKLLMGTSAGETILDAMKRAMVVGSEVLAHGNSSQEIVTADNIDDMNFLYNKFVINHQKFIDFGLNVRGVVRVGGEGNICGDSRTDEWVRLFYDYGDLYGVEEPHNHARFSGTTYEDYKGAVDKAIANKTFCPLLFHQAPDWLETLIDYTIAQGAVVSNYADVYDTYGSTADMVALESRISAIEQNDGNGVKY